MDKIITLRAPTPSDKRQWMKIVETAIADAEKKLSKSLSDNKLQKESNLSMIGTLEVKLLEVKKLASADRISNYLNFKFLELKPGLFCVFNLDAQSIRSKTCQSWPPKWGQNLIFSIFSLDSTLKISLYNYDRFSKDGNSLLLKKFRIYWRDKYPIRFFRVLWYKIHRANDFKVE